jgi:threonine/homoserine/homoserine lactone efflux protein
VISVGQLAAYLAVSVVMIVLPGPGVLFIVGRALAHGRRTAVATAVGHTLGGLAAGALISFGLGTILQRFADVFIAVKVAGAAYLVWLGVQAIRKRSLLAESFAAGGAVGSGGSADDRRSVRDGVVVGITNPKTYIMFGAVLPQFVNRAAGHAPVQMMLLVLISVSIGMVTDSIWGCLAGGVRTWFARSPRRFALVGGAGGLAMIGVGLTVALTGRKDLSVTPFIGWRLNPGGQHVEEDHGVVVWGAGFG